MVEKIHDGGRGKRRDEQLTVECLLAIVLEIQTLGN